MGGRFYRNQLRELVEFPLVPLVNRQGWGQPFYDDWEIILNGLNKIKDDVERFDLDQLSFRYIIDGQANEDAYLSIMSTDVDLYKYICSISRDKKRLEQLENLTNSDKISKVHLERTKEILNEIAGRDDWNEIIIHIYTPKKFSLDDNKYDELTRSLNDQQTTTSGN